MVVNAVGVKQNYRKLSESYSCANVRKSDNRIRTGAISMG